MPKNTTDKTLMWKGGKLYEPGADIPQDLADALGVIAVPSEKPETRVLGTEEELKPQSTISAPQSAKKGVK
jgi:hypothetical protein